jgi:hypothetical protein
MIYHGNQNLVFLGSSANERMRITPAGNVGIGVSIPLALLHVSGTALSSRYRSNNPTTFPLNNGGSTIFNWTSYISPNSVGVLKVLAWSPDDGGLAWAMKEFFLRVSDFSLLATLQTSGSSPDISISGGSIVVNNNTGSTRNFTILIHAIG